MPLQPSLSAAKSFSLPAATMVQLEAERGVGDGDIRQRSRASGGQTVHLAPGECRSWTFKIAAPAAPYAIAVTYANGKEGPNEILTVSVDGVAVSSFEDRDSGDAVEGWNLFVTDPAGTARLGAGAHTLLLESRGGDGCVEIDLLMVSPLVQP
jgi:hypothetical protein